MLRDYLILSKPILTSHFHFIYPIPSDLKGIVDPPSKQFSFGSINV